MHSSKHVPIVDLFAGPGGLGEGFSALNDGAAFKILVSAEMDHAAHQTLRLRSFFRLLKREKPSLLGTYYDFCNGNSTSPWGNVAEGSRLWQEAGREARQITLGSAEGNDELASVINGAGLGPETPWVLIGGPPCQAYSLAGRSRNMGKKGYTPESDHRHFLYREYLKIIQRYRPTVFVMENVKGILSSKVGGARIFHSILRDLADPDGALGEGFVEGYRIYSLTSPVVFDRSMEPEEVDAHRFVIKAEEYGIPQARHRVILLGVREGVTCKPTPLVERERIGVLNALKGLPRLRSRLSKEADSGEAWFRAVKGHLNDLRMDARAKGVLDELVAELDIAAHHLSGSLGFGSLRLPRKSDEFVPRGDFDHWCHDSRLRVWLNTETKGHMSGDLRRYLYAAAFAKAYSRSPKGHAEFQLSGLKPEHKNWESGKFSDRFRVQLGDRPSTTITSHISKDGHYFIHPDPSECRSLTVREAARLQTFPDNYFFQGNRTEQFHQVGNAVPPLLANQIAEIVAKMMASI